MTRRLDIPLTEVLTIRCQNLTFVGGHSQCQNEARYVNSMGQYHCGICDAQSPWLSVRLTDIPELLARVETMSRAEPTIFNLLKETVCAKKR